jgi:NAD(P)-dependent dehydrogenase (short-subunit alcohol dehydrogenase family)
MRQTESVHMSSNRFQDQVVFITGGASGLGLAAARRFAAEGAIIAIADLNTEAAETAAAEFPGAIAITVDVSQADQVAAAFAAAREKLGTVDVIFNNAGIDGKQQRLHEMDLENWDLVSRINGDGAFFVLKYGIAALLTSGGGNVVSTTSTVGLAAQVNIAPYSFTKGGLVNLTKSAAVEYAKDNIRINAVAPTAVRTPLVEHFIDSADDPKAMRELMENFNPIPGMPTPDDVADAVLFLASNEAKWITGHTLPVDGGYLAR